MPEFDIDAIERLAKDATPGPWVIRHGDGWYNKHSYEIEASDESHVAETLYAYNGEADAAYIVAACNAVPLLAKRLREQEGRIAELATENSNQKRVIQMLEYRVLELKGKPIPMEPRLPTCDALYHPRPPLHSNRSNAKEANDA